MSELSLVERLQQLQRFNIGVAESAVAWDANKPAIRYALNLLRSKFAEAERLLTREDIPLERRDEIITQLREGVLGVANLYGTRVAYDICSRI